MAHVLYVAVDELKICCNCQKPMIDEAIVVES